MRELPELRESRRANERAGLRVYRLLLALYPQSVRRRHDEELWQTGRDMAETAGAAASARFWLALYADTLAGALDERWRAMRGSTRAVMAAVAVTLLAAGVSLVAGLNLYQLEDSNPLTTAAYSASPLLRFSYDGVYLASLMAALAGLAVVLFAVFPARAALAGSLALAVIVLLGGFGGLLARHSLNGLALAGSFAGLLALCLLAGWGVARWLTPRRGPRAANLVGACVGVGVALAVDAVALIAHTLALNPVSHTLYMQGQIGGSSANALLIAMAAQALALVIWSLCIAVALGTGRAGHGATPPAG